jgi:subtilisin-like proprotein convertase family protein
MLLVCCELHLEISHSYRGTVHILTASPDPISFERHNHNQITTAVTVATGM